MKEIQSLTALRGIAAIWIVLHHFWPQTDSPVPFVIAKGYLAVDLFFILSGFVLYLVYSKALADGEFEYKRFLVKRFARLYPVHIVTLLLAALILCLGPSLGFAGRTLPYDFGQMIFLHATLLHAWGITETGGLNYPSWSLSAEAFAYALFPLLALFISRRRFAVMWCAILLVVFIVFVQLYWPASLPNPTQSLAFTRLENDWGGIRIFPEFLLGLAIAKQTERRMNGFLWLALGLLLSATGLCFDYDGITVFGFAALIGASAKLHLTAPKLLGWLGVQSYCIYMSHALVQIVGFKMIERIFDYEDSKVPVGFIIPLMVLTMLFSWVLHLWCERPARRMILSFSEPKSVAPEVPRSFPM